MAKKKVKTIKPWCWYCEREFETEKLLIEHQRSRHFSCETCKKKLRNLDLMVVHFDQVHNSRVDSIPFALPGRTSVSTMIHGMAGIPEEDHYIHRQKIEAQFQEELYETAPINESELLALAKENPTPTFPKEDYMTQYEIEKNPVLPSSTLEGEKAQRNPISLPINKALSSHSKSGSINSPSHSGSKNYDYSSRPDYNDNIKSNYGDQSPGFDYNEQRSRIDFDGQRPPLTYDDQRPRFNYDDQKSRFGRVDQRFRPSYDGQRPRFDRDGQRPYSREGSGRSNTTFQTPPSFGRPSYYQNPSLNNQQFRPSQLDRTQSTLSLNQSFSSTPTAVWQRPSRKGIDVPSFKPNGTNSSSLSSLARPQLPTGLMGQVNTPTLFKSSQVIPHTSPEPKRKLHESWSRRPTSPESVYRQHDSWAKRIISPEPLSSRIESRPKDRASPDFIKIPEESRSKRLASPERSYKFPDANPKQYDSSDLRQKRKYSDSNTELEGTSNKSVKSDNDKKPSLKNPTPDGISIIQSVGQLSPFPDIMELPRSPVAQDWTNVIIQCDQSDLSFEERRFMSSMYYHNEDTFKNEALDLKRHIRSRIEKIKGKLAKK